MEFGRGYAVTQGKEEWIYSWGAKTGTHDGHCFRHQRCRMEGKGRRPWESLCQKHRTADLGFESDYRRIRSQDKRCVECLKVAKKIGVVVY